MRHARAVLVILALLAPTALALVPSSLPAALASFERVGATFDRPLLVTHAGDGSGRLFVVQQGGLVRVISASGVVDATPYLDLRARVTPGGPGEQGLLGLAFDPAFETNGRVFASFTNGAGDSVLQRFTVAAPASGRPDLATATTLLEVDQPYSNHNGGHVAFGPDGYLYYGLGDGGSAGDPQRNGQKLSTLLGKMLRLDVSGATYAVPPSNPFVGLAGARGEIYEYGLRNPWRFSFDRLAGDLFIGDVGQNLWEEVDLHRAGSAAGENFGWNEWEGNAPYSANANPIGRTFPILDYAHQPHCSVTGGYVYRGAAAPLLAGAYIFGDYCSGHIWMAREVPLVGWTEVLVADTSYFISSFGEDEAGNVYVLDGRSSGALYRIEAS